MTAPQAATKAILAQNQSYDAVAQSNVDITGEGAGPKMSTHYSI